MRLTAQQIYDKMIKDDKILQAEGRISFNFADINITVKQKDVVGNIIQEWVQGWLDKNNIEYALNDNSQMPPDFYLNLNDRTKDLLEVKAFNRSASPAFDIADFRAYQKEIIEKPYMLDVDYLIFGYEMSDEGIVTIQDVWLKKVWEITRRMEDWPITLQVKEGHVHKIRPGVWYGEGKHRSDYTIFGSMVDFISAIEETVYQNDETRSYGSMWKRQLVKSYREHYGISLTIPKWDDIADNYDEKRRRKLAKAEESFRKAEEKYNKQVEKHNNALIKYNDAINSDSNVKIEKALESLKKAESLLTKYEADLEKKRTEYNNLQL